MKTAPAHVSQRMPHLIAETFDVPDREITLIEALRRLHRLRKPIFAWIRPDGTGELAIGSAVRVAGDSKITLTATQDRNTIAIDAGGPGDRFEQADALLSMLWEASDIDPVAFGGAAFGPGAHMADEWGFFPRLSLSVPEFRMRFDADGAEIVETSVGAVRPAAQDRVLAALEAEVRPVAEPTSFEVRARGRQHWDPAIRSALGEIEAGAIDKIVLARSVQISANAAFDVPSLVARLRRQNPTATVFAIAEAGGSFVGATPELLLRCRDGIAESTPLAGTLVPGADVPDAERAKLAREHAYARDHVIATFRRHCTDVEADASPRELSFGAVTHLGTHVTGRLDETTPLRLAGAMHPTPAVGAVPADTIERIPRLEDIERGWYAGFVGRVDPNAAEFVLALRCGLIRGRRASIYAGCGIVDGSDPDAEFEESRMKLRPMLEALVTA